MKKITLIIFALVISSQLFSQSLYNRAWGTLLPIKFKVIPSRPVNDTAYFYNNNLVAYVDQKLNTIFHSDYDLNRIYKTSTTSPISSLLYTIPHTGGGSLIEAIKTTSKGEIIICGRTLVNNLATAGAYSTTQITSLFTGSGYIAKIDSSGNLVWFTYFHPIVQNASSLTIDKDDNIYVLTNREKTDILTSNTFQSNGDPSHPLTYMNAISKLDSDGRHQWSTFYSKDQSKIRSIVAAANGIYVYGEHLDSTSTSNYFGTVGSYQEYATGMTTGGTKNANTAFLSKLNFNGTRAWSSYFGIDRSYTAHNFTLLNNNSLAVINDDAYILTTHEIRPENLIKLSTKDAFLENSVSTTGRDLTLTKFSGNGQRAWTTFVPTGNILQTNNNELFISSSVKTTDPFASTLTTNNAYQKNHGGLDDLNTLILPNDGKTMTYSSYYGFNGLENGAVFPTSKGYFNIGYTYDNISRFASQTFSTPHAPIKKLSRNTKGETTFKGDFIAYFTTESVSNTVFEKLNFSIYPNPAAAVLNIQSKENLPDNTNFIIYDVSGKKVLTQYAKSTNLNEINISSLSSGVYILQINHATFIQSTKFIKQ